MIDNLAPYGDTTLTLDDGLGIGAVSSITAAFIAQLLTIMVADRLVEAGRLHPFTFLRTFQEVTNTTTHSKTLSRPDPPHGVTHRKRHHLECSMGGGCAHAFRLSPNHAPPQGTCKPP